MSFHTTGLRRGKALTARARLCVHVSVDSAKAWYLLAAQTAIYELGGDSPRVLELMKLAGAKDSTVYLSWAAKESMTVGGPKSGFGLPDAAAFEEVKEGSDGKGKVL